MKNGNKRMLALLLALVLLFSACPLSAFVTTAAAETAYASSNTTVSNIVLPSEGTLSGSFYSYYTSASDYDSGYIDWSFDCATGVLSVSGNTGISYWDYPWDDFAIYVQKIVINEGISMIARYAFDSCSNLKEIRIPKTVKRIEYNAFGGNSSIVNVYFDGTPVDWQDVLNSELHNVFVYFKCDCGGSFGEFITVKEPTCLAYGKAESRCDSCSSKYVKAIPLTDHRFENDECTVCGYAFEVKTYSSVESAHPYGNSMDQSWNVECEGAKSITLQFTSNTDFERNYDYLYIYDENNVLQNSYTGSQLSSKTVTVSGEKVRIRLKSDGSAVRYGFKADVSAIVCKSPDMKQETCAYDYYIYDKNGKQETTILKYVGTDTGVTVPDSMEGCSVTAIGPHAFRYTNIENVVIPDSVTQIGKYAFSDCKKLTGVSLGNGLQVIGDSAFYYCSALTTIELPDSITTIGVDAFSKCSKLEYNVIDMCKYLGNTNNPTLALVGVDSKQTIYINIAKNTKIICSYAFADCRNLTSITIPDSVTAIGDYAFRSCYNLKDLYITDPNSWCKINFGVNALRYDDLHVLDKNGNEVTEVVLDSSVTTIPDCAFRNCESLTSISIPNSVTDIAYSAFSGCSGLTSITIPDSVISIGDEAFYGCDSLVTVEIPDGVTSIGSYAFYSYGNLRMIAIPTSVTQIGYAAFYYSCTIYYAGAESQWERIRFGEGYDDYDVVYHHTHDFSLFPAVTKDATCTEAGYIEHICIYGETYRVETAPALGHDYSGEVTVIPSSCTVRGHKVTQCTRCDAVKESDYVDSLGHKMVCLPAANPSCTTSGHTACSVCERCEKMAVGSSIPATGHKDANEDGKCDTCGSNNLNDIILGEKRYTSVEDGAITYLRFKPSISGYYSFASVDSIYWRGYFLNADKKEIKSSSGGWGGFQVTCYLQAGKTYYLGVEDEYRAARVYDVVLTYDGECKHNDITGYNQKDATCTESGYTSGVFCAVCETWIEGHEEIPVKSHNYNAATCTAPKTCKTCGATEGVALGHDYADATCTAPKTCKNCGATSGSKLDHDYKAATCTAPKTCKTCKATSGKALGHSYKAATCTAPKTCKVCGGTDGSKLSHTYKTVTTKATLSKDGKVEKKCSECGKVSSSTTIKYVKTVKLSATSYTYSGGVKTPTVTVKDSAGKTLKKNTDYTVSYASGRKNVGTYKVTITFKGKYSGTKVLTFKINPKAASINKLTAKTKGLTVKLNRQTTQSTGYEIQYATAKSFKSAKTVTATYTTSTKSISGLKAKTTYYVRVRTYKTVSGVKYYSNWSTAKYIKTK